jgi:hypothetical protein
MKSKGILMALVIFTLILGCGSKGDYTVPDELIGVWRTSAEKYENCYLELRKDLIIFVNEDVLGHLISNSISKIEKVQKNKGILYSIYYESEEGQTDKISFHYDPSEGGIIRLKNQDKIEWRKENGKSP